MNILNVSPWEQEAAYDGKTYVWAPKESKAVYNNEALVHICSSAGHKGLVHLVFNEDMAEKYDGNVEAFEKVQTLNGYESLIKGLKEAWRNEMGAMAEVKASKKGASDLHFIDPDRFQNKIKQVEKLRDSFKIASEKQPIKKGRPIKEIDATV